MKNVFDVLVQRGFLHQTNDDEGVKKLLSKPGATIYCGFDPSADSLHVGHLIPFRGLHLLQEHGHRSIYLTGGATGLVGDPTGKEKVRKRLIADEVNANAKKIRDQVEELGLLRFRGENPAFMVNNYDWLSEYNLIEDFLMKIAPLISINSMVAMRTFAVRLAEKKNLSFLEFFYPILQAWDFLYLFEKYDCRLQVGGQDQWANMLLGVDLVKRFHGEQVFAFTFPLLVTSSGKKMGKTEKGSLWLDEKKTSVFDFYQAIEKTPDELVSSTLKMLTDLSISEIEEILAMDDPRAQQKRLAFEVTKTIHGEEKALKAQKDADRLFGTGEGGTETISSFQIPKKGMELDEILTHTGILSSKSEVRRRCVAGAVRVDNEKVKDPKTLIEKGCIVRYGKKIFLKIEIQET